MSKTVPIEDSHVDSKSEAPEKSCASFTPTSYLMVYYDANNEVQMGAEGRFSPTEIEMMLRTAVAKMNLMFARREREADQLLNPVIPSF